MEPPRLSAERLAPAVRRSLEAPDAWPLQWSCEPLGVSLINPSTAGLYRILGTARLDDGRTVPWQLVLKVVHLRDFTGTPLEDGYIKNPEDWNYWKREVLARRSELPDQFTAPLRPARCWATEDLDDHTAWLLMEDLDNSPHSRPRVADWSVQALADAAYDLVAFSAQGVGLVDTVQALPWVARNWLRSWVATFRAAGADHAVSHPGCWNHPFVRDRLPTSAQEAFSALMVRVEPLLKRLEAMPMSVAHLDLQASNLFSTAGPEGHRTVVIDWGFFGVAPIGEDLGYQISQNVFFGVVRPDEAQEHERTATEAYLTACEHSDGRARTTAFGSRPTPQVPCGCCPSPSPTSPTFVPSSVTWSRGPRSWQRGRNATSTRSWTTGARPSGT